MEPASARLLSVNVTVERESARLAGAGFYERRTHSAVPRSHFITRDEFERAPPLYVSDLISRLGGRAAKCIRGRIIVDGVLVANRKGEALDLLSVADIEGLEVHVGPAEVPMVFDGMSGPGGPAGCAIVIWTR